MFDLRISRFAVCVPLQAGHGCPLAVFQTMTGGLVLIPDGGWFYNSDGRVIIATDFPAHELLEQGVLVPQNTDETAVALTWREQSLRDSHFMRSKVLVTRRCNNRCRYCVVNPEATDMSLETALAMDRFYLRCIAEAQAQKVLDEYTGGEVFLNAEIVLQSAGRRFYYCQGKGIEYGFTIISNGTLLERGIIVRMREVGLTGIRISLAGPEEVHDFWRPSLDGGKTYYRILGNLQRISGLVPITIECQYDAGSNDYERFLEMPDDLRRRGIDIVNICFTPILPTRSPRTTFSAGAGDPAILLHLMHEAYARGYPQFEEPPVNCCSADFPWRMTFDTDGSLIPCPILQSGEMVFGNVLNGIDFIAHAQILQRKIPEMCLNECELLPLCLGGCRYQALVQGQGFNGVSCHYDTLRMILEAHIREKAAQAMASADDVQPDDHTTRK
jgi:uncharacterized protein